MKNHDHIQPPRWAERLLSWYAGRAHIEDLQGDLEEIFYDEVEQLSVRKAKFNYCHQVLALIFSYALKKRQVDQSYHPLSFTQNNTAMFRNYVKVALRSLSRNKFFTIINVLGLSFGMSIAILCIGFSASVLKYDKFQEHYDKLYRIVSIVDDKTQTNHYASTPYDLGDVLKNNYSSVKETTRLNRWMFGEADYKGKKIPMSGFFAEPSFFDLFSFEMVEGNAASALSQPYQIILTEKVAQKLFSGADPIGQVINFKELGDFTVTGIAADLSRGSHINFEVLASHSTLALLERDGKVNRVTDNWTSFFDNYTYVKLEGNEIEEVEQILTEISTQKYQNQDEAKANFELQPIAGIVTVWEDFDNDFAPYFGGMTLYGFGLITLLILLPACFNYSNISISRAIKRAKEIGIRKVVGGYKQQIWLQFITETVIICLIALLGAIGIYLLIIDRFVSHLAAGSSLNFDLNFLTVVAFVVFSIITGILAGIVPAAYFSKIDPVTALKGSSNMKIFGKTSFKKVLITAQFTLSLFFIIGITVQFKQFFYSLNFDLGFEQENLLDVQIQDVDIDLLKNEFSKHSSVKSVSMSSHILGTEGFARDWLKYPETGDSIEIRQIFIDENYLENLGLTIVAGENFGTSEAENKKGLIVNESFFKELKLTNAIDALGLSFTMPDGEESQIIGVVKDFNYALLRQPIEGFIMRYDKENFRYANVKVQSNDHFILIDDLEKSWSTLGTEQKMEARFFDKEVHDAFLMYMRIIEVFGFLGFMAITVASLGMLGMVVYSSETRAKEVGIRKVLGASTKSLLYLLSKEYVSLMLIAALIASPLSILFYTKLMEQATAFSVGVGAIDIVIAVGFLFLIGAVTLASQTIKRALANPVDSLGSE